MLVTLYGPTPGGGLLASTASGVLLGTNPSAGNASTLSNGPYGAVRWIVILPVALSAVIPEIVFAFPVEYAVAPTTIGVMNAPAPPHGMCTARSKERTKSDAFTGAPFEYFRPLRSVAVYVLPPSEIVGSAVARPGISWPPATPL